MYIHFFSSDYDYAHSASHVRSEHFLTHTHPYYELLYIICGDVDIIYNERVIPVRPHSLTLVSPNVSHGLRVLTNRSYERYALHFTRELLSPQLQELLLQVFTPALLPRGENLLRNISSTNALYFLRELDKLEKITPEEVRNRLVPPLVEALLTCVYQYLCTMKQVPLELDKPDSGAKIVAYVRENFKEHITLDALSERFYCSKGYINNAFKRETGTTAIAYLQQLRLKYAQSLLGNGFSAAEAASLAGFTEYSSFYRAYVKAFGTTPSFDKMAASQEENSPLPTLPLQDAPHGAHRRLWDLYPDTNPPETDPSILHD